MHQQPHLARSELEQQHLERIFEQLQLFVVLFVEQQLQRVVQQLQLVVVVELEQLVLQQLQLARVPYFDQRA